MKNLFIIVILLCPSIVFSAPDKYINFAMESPISAHDFVIFKTNLELKDLFQNSAYRHYFDHGENITFIDYDYDINKYVLHMKSTIDSDVKINNKELNEVSKMLFLTAKTRLGVKGTNPDSELAGEYHSSFSSDLGRITHKKSKPENFENEIDKRIIVELTLIYDDNVIICSSPLLGSKILCSL